MQMNICSFNLKMYQMNTDLKQFILQHVLIKCTKGCNGGISVKDIQRLYENNKLKFVTKTDISNAIAGLYDDGLIKSFAIDSRKIYIDLK